MNEAISGEADGGLFEPKHFHESGNDHFSARHYAKIEGRFISPDWSSDPEPIPYGDLADP